tara:strand:- start:832 stop:2211 length:1380 start_codon:yes stop_codon:yes gene_type:complete
MHPSQEQSTSLLQRRDVFLGLSLTEFWERFALAGLKSMLTVLLVEQLIPQSDSIHGFDFLCSLLDRRTDVPNSPVALASQIYGFTNALVYLSIPIGGLIGDLLLGRRGSVLTGGASMIAGLLLMVSITGFLLGLILFAAGTGLLKGNLSVQLGSLFESETQRRKAYSYYLVFLNVGVVCGPLALGSVALLAGWQIALGLAAGGLALALAIYIAIVGGKYRSANSSANSPQAPSGRDTEPQGAGYVVAMTRLCVGVIATYLCFAAYGQIANIVLVWSQQRVDLSMGEWDTPVGWILAMDGLLTILLIFASQAVFRYLSKRGIQIGPLTQIGLGCVMCAAGYLVLAYGESATGGSVSPLLLLGYLVLIDLAVVLVWPSGLSLATSLAPKGQTGLWVGLFYLHGFFASLWVGWIGTHFEAMDSTAFWLVHSAVSACGAVLIIISLLFPVVARRNAYATTISA